MLLRSKAVVLFAMVSLVASPVLAQQAREGTALGFSNGVTRDGLSIALAKLERKGDEVGVWIAFRKVGPASGGARFELKILDDRGNTYPISPLGPAFPGIVILELGVDLALLPVGFTWIASAGVGMPAKAPIKSILVRGGPLGPGGVSLDPRSAKWPTIDLNVVRKNDFTGKKFRLSRDLTLWLGQPLWRQQGRTVLCRLPIYVENEDYNAHSLGMSVLKYYLYLESGEVVPLYVDASYVDPRVKRRSPLIHYGGVDNSEWEIPGTTTVEGGHVIKPLHPFTGKLVAIMVEIKGHSLGFLSLQDKRESASAWIVTEVEGSYNDITYANGGFVAVGQSGMILKSADGKNWVDGSAGLKEALLRDVETHEVEDVACKAVAYGNGAFVVLCHYDPGSGTGTLMLASPDGNQWSRYWWEEDHELNSVAHGNDMFVAVGRYNRILTSPDGKQWKLNEAVIGEYWKQDGGHDHFNGVTYGNGLFVAVGGSEKTGYPVVGLVRTSADGENWTRQTFTDGYLNDVTYGNGLFVAVGEAGLIMTSTDGGNWSREISGTRERLTSVSYGDGLFVAVGEWGVILTSSDGKNWNKQTSGTRHDLRGVTYGNGLFVAVGDGIILTLRSGKISDTSNSEPAAAQKPTTTIKERLL